MSACHPLGRRLLGPAVALGLASLITALPRTALAQFGDGGSSSSGLGITINPTVWRFHPDGVTPYNFRAANFNPADINFQDCSDNIILQFSLYLTGLPTTDTIEVWAGSTDCTQSSAREESTGPYCWQVAPRGGFANSMTSVGNIYARNITQYLDNATTLHPAPITSVPGIDACHTQTTSGSVQLSLYFIFLANDGISVDAYATYGQNVDMVGPLAPTLQLPIGIGDGILLLNWTPQIDSTIQGFQVYAQDQGPGGLGLMGDGSASVVTTPIYCKVGGTTVCKDAGLPHVDATSDGASTDSSTLKSAVADAACTTTYPDGAAYTEVTDASGLASLTDADLASQGCQRSSPVLGPSAQQQSAAGGTCSSNVLVDYFTTSVTNTTATVEGGTTVTDGGTSLVSATDASSIGGLAAVGISQIDAAVYGVGNVGGNTTSSYIITSIRYPDGDSGPLINGHQYAVAVAAYDDDQNTGILSNLGCQTPEPVIDFWDKYKDDGGLAGGGFCALEGSGGAAGGVDLRDGRGTRSHRVRAPPAPEEFMIRPRLAASLVAKVARFTLPVLVSGAAVAGALAVTRRSRVRRRRVGRPVVAPQELRVSAELRARDSSRPLPPARRHRVRAAQPGPYQAIFGDDLRWAVEVEFDYQAYRIPHLGTIGPGSPSATRPRAPSPRSSPRWMARRSRARRRRSPSTRCTPSRCCASTSSRATSASPSSRT